MGESVSANCCSNAGDHPRQLEEGLATHRQTRVRLGVALVQKGFVTEEQLAQALSAALNILEVDLRRITLEWNAVHMLVPASVSPTISSRSPLTRRRHETTCGGDVRPLNLAAIEEMEFTTGLA